MKLKGARKVKQLSYTTILLINQLTLFSACEMAKPESETRVDIRSLSLTFDFLALKGF